MSAPRRPYDDGASFLTSEPPEWGGWSSPERRMHLAVVRSERVMARLRSLDKPTWSEYQDALTASRIARAAFLRGVPLYRKADKNG